ncbi:hypothetical protein EV426DRAFT_610679, partial [Tirmania nivea]
MFTYSYFLLHSFIFPISCVLSLFFLQFFASVGCIYKVGTHFTAFRYPSLFHFHIFQFFALSGWWVKGERGLVDWSQSQCGGSEVRGWGSLV